MNTSIQTFASDDFGTIRVVKMDGEPWFVAKDVCDALGIATNHLREDGRGLDDDEVASLPNWEGKGSAPLIVSEAGLYSLVLKSRKPEARKFKRWVTHEVLPSIRRDGGYMVARPDDTDEEIMARALIVAQRTIERKDQRIAGLTEDNARMLPKAVAYDSIIDTDGTTTIRDTARYLTQMGTSMSVMKLYGYLRADGFICKGSNAPTKRGISRGLVVQIMSTRASGKANEPYARLTQRGVDWCITHYAKMPAQMRV